MTEIDEGQRRERVVEYPALGIAPQAAPAGNEREALAQSIRDALGVTPETIAAGHQRPGNTDDLARDLIARGFGFRRSEVPSAECPQCHRVDEMHKLGCGERFGAEPHGERRDLTPCGNLVCTGCRVCGCPALGIAPQAAPTDDEREARLDYVIDAAVPVDEFPSWRFRYSRRIAEAVRAAGFRRSEVPEPSAALAAIERAKAFLTDVSETNEMRNRNAYGALKDIASEVPEPSATPRPCRLPRCAPPCIGCRCEPQSKPTDAPAEQAAIAEQLIIEKVGD